MLKKEYETLEYGDLVRVLSGPLRGLILEVVHAEENDIFCQQQNNHAFIYVRNYRCFEVVHHWTDLERLLQRLHDTARERITMPERHGTNDRDYWYARANKQFELRNEENITRNLFFILSENGVNTIEDLLAVNPNDISRFKGLDAASCVYTQILREKEMNRRNVTNNQRQAV